MKNYQTTNEDRVNKLRDPERLEALARSGLLDRSIAQRLDHLAFAACRLLLADVAQLNALDQQHQFTVVGWPPDDWPSYPVEDSGCREVVLTGEPFVVPDTTKHALTCRMPWTDKFKGYLGVPVIYDGHILGSLCVLSFDPRPWKAYEVAALSGVARLAGMSLDGADRD